MSTPDTSPQREGSELIERLRAHAASADTSHATADALHIEAADRLQALEAENERLRGLAVSQDHAPSITAVTSGQSHTPGPWVVEQSNEQTPHLWVVAEENPGVAKIEVCDYDDGLGPRLTDEDQANARLIAAAPELLKALKAVSDMLMARPDIVNKLQPLMGFAEKAVFEAARAAIAKAEREQ